MYESENSPVQPVSLGRGVALAGYGSTAGIWLMAFVVLLLLFGAFWWMGRYQEKTMQMAAQQRQAVSAEREPPAGY